METEQDFSERLELIHEVVMPEDMGKFMGKDEFKLLRIRPVTIAGGMRITGLSQPNTVGSGTDLQSRRRRLLPMPIC